MRLRQEVQALPRPLRVSPASGKTDVSCVSGRFAPAFTFAHGERGSASIGRRP
ncbi:hypothetical protein A33M_3725 [Rhodovulum sp. PH10]|nr:hypothetical protein A33M_3725 [Rhodovulum sp. PH10]